MWEKTPRQIQICVIGPGSNKICICWGPHERVLVWAVFALTHSPRLCIYMQMEHFGLRPCKRDGWFGPQPQRALVFHFALAVCNSLSRSLSFSQLFSTRRVESAVSPASNEKRAVCFIPHTGRRCFAGKKGERVLLLCAASEREGALAAPAQGLVRKFMLLWHSEQVLSACWLADVFRYFRCEVLVYLLPDASSWCSFAFRVLGEDIGTCVWRGIKCNSDLTRCSSINSFWSCWFRPISFYLSIYFSSLCDGDKTLTFGSFVVFQFNFSAHHLHSAALYCCGKQKQWASHRHWDARHAGSDGLIWFVFEMEFDALLVNKSKAAIKKWIFRNIGRWKSQQRQKAKIAQRIHLFHIKIQFNVNNPLDMYKWPFLLRSALDRFLFQKLFLVKKTYKNLFVSSSRAALMWTSTVCGVSAKCSW